MALTTRKSYGHSTMSCRRGHLRIPENISTRPNGDIRCQACERENKRFHRYGLTPEQWEEMFNSQGRCCAVCKRTETKTWDWHTDHSHRTHAVRGILCNGCNWALGAVDDNVEILSALIAYLQRTEYGNHN